MLTAIIWLGVGILAGMWLGKHPEDARRYGEALAARVKALFKRG